MKTSEENMPLSGKIIAVDVDMTIVDSGAHWFQWLNERSVNGPNTDSAKRQLFSGQSAFGNKLDYDQSRYFTMPTHIDAFDFWRQNGLYDNMEPVNGAVDGIRRLSELGAQIVFVSHTQNRSEGISKAAFLRRHFAPYYDGIVWTKEKHFIRCDYLIDDRMDYMEDCAPSVTRILFDTKYAQNVHVPKDVLKSSFWYLPSRVKMPWRPTGMSVFELIMKNEGLKV